MLWTDILSIVTCYCKQTTPEKVNNNFENANSVAATCAPTAFENTTDASQNWNENGKQNRNDLRCLNFRPEAWIVHWIVQMMSMMISIWIMSCQVKPNRLNVYEFEYHCPSITVVFSMLRKHVSRWKWTNSHITANYLSNVHMCVFFSNEHTFLLVKYFGCKISKFTITNS